jgi:hypothetical protein
MSNPILNKCLVDFANLDEVRSDPSIALQAYEALQGSDLVMPFGGCRRKRAKTPPQMTEAGL